MFHPIWARLTPPDGRVTSARGHASSMRNIAAAANCAFGRVPMRYVHRMDDEVSRLLNARLATLSERQREVLRLVSRDRNSKEIARELGLSDETVKNHVKAATRRLGVTSRFDAARLLRIQEEDDPRVVIDPSRVIAVAARPVTEEVSGADRGQAEVREHRASFDFDADDFDRFPKASRPVSREDETRPSALRVVTLVAVLTVALAIAVISAAPLAKSVQDLANMIEPPRRHS